MNSIEALTSERDALTAALVELDAQYEQVDGALDALYAAAERTPSAEAKAAVDQAEQAKTAAETARRRKRAALVACEADLATAKAALAAEQRAMEFSAMLGIVEEIAKVAKEIDTNPLAPERWALLVERCNTLGLHYHKAGGRTHRLFDDPRQCRAILWEEYAQAADAAMGYIIRARQPISRLGQMLNLARANGLIRELRDSA